MKEEVSVEDSLRYLFGDCREDVFLVSTKFLSREVQDSSISRFFGIVSGLLGRACSSYFE
jgi:hypothetical protein